MLISATLIHCQVSFPKFQIIRPKSLSILSIIKLYFNVPYDLFQVNLGCEERV
jgi:hypothetical protein